MSLVLDLLIAALAIVGALGFLVSALALLRVRDALSMVNSLGPATGVGVPSAAGGGPAAPGPHRGMGHRQCRRGRARRPRCARRLIDREQRARARGIPLGGTAGPQNRSQRTRRALTEDLLTEDLPPASP